MDWIRYLYTLVLLVLLGVVAPTDQSAASNGNAGDSGKVEIVFSFDTTGSMYPVIGQVRQVVSDMIRRLQSDIPGIRIAVFAHGDWTDARKNYASKWIDFTTDVDRLQDFVQNVEQTAGGDMPEAYELVLHQVGWLSWTPGSRRSLIMIGDNLPHEADYRHNVMRLDWRNETDHLRNMGVRIYAIRALDYNSESFYRTIARKTGGFYLKLDNFDSILKFIMAISYREHGLQYLEAYEREVEKEGMTPELRNLFKTLKEKPARRSPRSQLDPTPRLPSGGTTPQPTTTTTTERYVPPKLTDIYKLHVDSSISYRFATTVVTSRVANKVNASSEVVFNIVLPKAAFITNFTMVIDGVAYPGKVEEKEQAKKTYDAARKRGESAGHVAAKPRDSNKFRVSINVAALKKVDFELVYQELLQRRLGTYSHVIHIDPGQVVRDLKVKVNIHESRDLTLLRVPPLQDELLNDIEGQLENPHAVVTRPAANKASILYRPTPDQQRHASASGVRGKFTVEYDVVRTKDAGEIQVVDGYFVHYLAPDGLPPSPKSIVFVLDSSGSMQGRKMKQLKDAMQVILNDLRPEDHFNVIHFSAFYFAWNEKGVVPATHQNKKEAQAWIQNIAASGSTNIDLALHQGMKALEHRSNVTGVTSLPSASLLVFLTDGEPTAGVTNTAQILKNAMTKNRQRFTVFSLGFGDRLDFPFLTKLSLQNHGFARRIYEDSDAALQLEGFYNEIATPTMSQVEVDYLDEQVDSESLTKTSFRDYFNGTEIIITGSLRNKDVPTLTAAVTANTIEGAFSFQLDEMVQDDSDAPPVLGLQNNMERMWAYLSIKELLKQALTSTEPAEKQLYKEKALNMSLKYHFVTPLTSMVVVKPREEAENVEAESAEHEEEDGEVKKSGSGKIHSYKPAGLPGPSGSSSSSSHRRKHYPSFADSDPHFMVNIKGSETPVCFDVMGVPGQVFNLVHDSVSDIIVNGLIVGKKPDRLSKLEKEKPKTYFGKIAVFHRNVSLIVTPLKIRYGKVDIQWNSNMTVADGRVSLNLASKNLARISVGSASEFVIVRHKVKANHPVKVSFLGFYIDKDVGLSTRVHGLLGQFKRLEIGVDEDIVKVQPKSSSVLHFYSDPGRASINVTAGHRQNLIQKEVVPCWFVHNNGRHLLDGSHLDYIVPHIAFRRPPTGLRKKHFL